jgi:hypothetical protein
MSRIKREIERLREEEGIDVLQQQIDDLDDEFWNEVYLREDAKKFNQYQKDEQARKTGQGNGNSDIPSV